MPPFSSTLRYKFRKKTSLAVLFVFILGGGWCVWLFHILSKKVSNVSSTSPNNVVKNCKIAIGVLSKASDHEKRDIIRRTWGHSLTSTSKLFFVIYEPVEESAPHEQLEFERERTVSHDLLILNSTTMTEYSRSLEWFSWAAQRTNCDIIFKTKDDTYLRVQRLEKFLNTAFGGEKPKLKYFGALGKSNETQNAFMMGPGYGVSRDVALWMYTHKNISVHSPSDDVGIGNLLSFLHRSSNLEYYTDSDSFGNVCHSRSVLDSPLLSHNFNMYIRHQEDVRNKFCVDSGAGTHLPKSADSYFSFEPVISSRLSLLDDSSAPWNKSNRWQYTEDRDTSFVRTAYTFLPWLATTGKGKFGGSGVFEKWKADEKALYESVVEKAKGVVQRAIQKCTKQRLVGSWLKTWGKRKEHVVHLQCTGQRVQAALVHVPFKASGEVEVFSPAYVVGPNRLVVIVPISCRLDTLRSFLRTSGQQISLVAGRATKLVLAWSHCPRAADNFTGPEIGALAQEFRQSARSVDVQTVYFEDGSDFSRSRALNAGIRACSDDDIAVVLDVDVRVKADFFLDCLAFARPGHSMYFPIMFSRFNPAVISTFGEVMSYSPKGRAWLARPDTISAETGVWRDFSLGMVAMHVADARRVGLFDARIEGWGNEDVDFFERAQAAGYVAWRLYEPNEVHLYHPKDCSGFKGTDRYTMCLSVQLRAEGNQLQMAIMLQRKEEELAQRKA